jgi:hypothetical protein
MTAIPGLPNERSVQPMARTKLSRMAPAFHKAIVTSADGFARLPGASNTTHVDGRGRARP